MAYLENYRVTLLSQTSGLFSASLSDELSDIFQKMQK